MRFPFAIAAAGAATVYLVGSSALSIAPWSIGVVPLVGMSALVSYLGFEALRETPNRASTWVHRAQATGVATGMGLAFWAVSKWGLLASYLVDPSHAERVAVSLVITLGLGLFMLAGIPDEDD